MSLELTGSGCCNSGSAISLDLTLASVCCTPPRVTTSSASGTERDLIRITSADFYSAYVWKGANSEGVGVLPAYSLKVFYNDGNRYLDEGTEWTRTTDGFTLTGLDTSTGTMTFYVHINKV